MNKIKILSLFLLVFNYYANEIFAQDGYTYTLAHNSGYSFTVQAVPNASANNFTTSVQSYGFTIILPDGVTINTGSTTSLGNAASATFFDGTNVAQPTLDGYLVTETLGSPVALPAPSAAINSNIFTFTVNGNPTSGELKILENNSALATTVTPLKSFMQADMIDNGMAQFVNVVDPNAAAVSGMSTFNFATLSRPEVEKTIFSIYPNPVTTVLNISMEATSFLKAEIYDLQGKKLFESKKTNIDVSHISNGIYILKIIDTETSVISTEKFVKK
ncbi:T9SS type A sorting domain-containing protein [Kordia sp.]|uniref:T9SS type A sorting domain-containing protein n=1 Tax=Kordia sp. TaxID=1965332 RepID=UPI0025C1200D|nr:T9SS type A sorting domain-containing protein [Kordia sp.]MCH2196506.1 T9SS type A sorting domain-containing protein [Kordia sp.]